MTQALKVECDQAAGFRGMMRRFPATVSIITSNDGIRDHGMTVTALTSVSMDPPSLVTCLNNRTLLHEMLLERPGFAVNVLDCSQTDLSQAFSGGVAPEQRFNVGDWVRDEMGMLVLKSAHATVTCRRTASVPFGTHTLFVGEVVSANVDDSTTALLYSEASYCVSQPR